MTSARPGVLDAMDQALGDLMRRVRTLIPANVVAYVPPTPGTPASVTVQVARRIADLAGRSEPIPPIPGVPIAWPGAGDVMIWADLAPGDELILGVTDRNIRAWLARNGLHDPGPAPIFDLSSCVAWPVSMTATKGVSADPGYLHVGRRDGTALVSVSLAGADVTIEAPVIRLGQVAPTPVALAGQLAAALATAASAAVTASVPNDGGAAAFGAFASSMAGANYATTKTVAE